MSESGCRAAGRSSPAGAARSRSTTTAWRRTTAATCSIRTWQGVSWSSGACRARSLPTATARQPRSADRRLRYYCHGTGRGDPGRGVRPRPGVASVRATTGRSALDQLRASARGAIVGSEERTPPVRLWGGRFESGPAEALTRLSMSVQFDWRLARYDLLASRAHAGVLHRAGLLDDRETARLLAAIENLSQDCLTGAFRPSAADEDVHTALERGLLERVGSLGGKLRAGRSRNDQVATDLRLYLRDHARLVAARVAELETALLAQAAEHLTTPAPGMTHLQHAQPVVFAHQLLAHAHALARDVSRLRDW